MPRWPGQTAGRGWRKPARGRAVRGACPARRSGRRRAPAPGRHGGSCSADGPRRSWSGRRSSTASARWMRASVSVSTLLVASSEKQDGRIGQHRPGETDQLPLAQRQVAAALADRRVKALRKRLEQVEAIEPADDFDRLRRRWPRAGRSGCCRSTRAAEQKILLQHDSQMPAERAGGDRPQVAGRRSGAVPRRASRTWRSD